MSQSPSNSAGSGGDLALDSVASTMSTSELKRAYQAAALQLSRLDQARHSIVQSLVSCGAVPPADEESCLDSVELLSAQLLKHKHGIQQELQRREEERLQRTGDAREASEQRLLQAINASMTEHQKHAAEARSQVVMDAKRRNGHAARKHWETRRKHEEDATERLLHLTSDIQESEKRLRERQQLILQKAQEKHDKLVEENRIAQERVVEHERTLASNADSKAVANLMVKGLLSVGVHTIARNVKRQAPTSDSCNEDHNPVSALEHARSAKSTKPKASEAFLRLTRANPALDVTSGELRRQELDERLKQHEANKKAEQYQMMLQHKALESRLEANLNAVFAERQARITEKEEKRRVVESRLQFMKVKQDEVSRAQSYTSADRQAAAKARASVEPPAKDRWKSRAHKILASVCSQLLQHSHPMEALSPPEAGFERSCHHKTSAPR